MNTCCGGILSIWVTIMTITFFIRKVDFLISRKNPQIFIHSEDSPLNSENSYLLDDSNEF